MSATAPNMTEIDLNSIQVGDIIRVTSTASKDTKITIEGTVAEIIYGVDDIELYDAHSYCLNTEGDDYTFTYELLERPDPLKELANLLYQTWVSEVLKPNPPIQLDISVICEQHWINMAQSLLDNGILSSVQRTADRI